ncbi:hypothetical protein L2E82_20242 [Cichorium intybus]|uniref:Uncharacterized protein n=1 Tax=Cichorium intybus TaxID=13427 RepID=A0ACB9DTI4_CICIN|nr:hypothetical protein L2E82_20242 [Cichorium intybus]
MEDMIKIYKELCGGGVELMKRQAMEKSDFMTHEELTNTDVGPWVLCKVLCQFIPFGETYIFMTIKNTSKTERFTLHRQLQIRRNEDVIFSCGKPTIVAISWTSLNSGRKMFWTCTK